MVKVKCYFIHMTLENVNSLTHKHNLTRLFHICIELIPNRTLILSIENV